MSTKSQLLTYLKARKGRWISGESLSNILSISRSAVWKHINKLRREGYGIESFPKKGYRFYHSPDLLLVEEIREGLTTALVGQKDIIYFKETDSTNLRARDLADKGAPEGTVVISENQTRGRGRRGRDWFSQVGKGIYASIILRPSIPPSEAPKIVIMASVAGAETLVREAGVDATIKWPNDLLVNGKKIAGILIEIGSELDRIHYLIVGIGLNVNIPADCFPADLKERATSILVEREIPLSRVHLIRGFLQWFEYYYDVMQAGRFDEILLRWNHYSDIVGRRVMIDVSGEKYTGVVSHVDHNGVLVVMDTAGTEQRIFSGDVRIINNGKRRLRRS